MHLLKKPGIAMMQIVDGLNLILTGGTTIYGLPDSIKFLGQGYILGIPVAVIIFAFHLQGEGQNIYETCRNRR